uniref:TIR domain-containing protein n=1 Tax=Alexandrium monilatum TaxID=311494 RepID=A0A6T1G835_9DINO
MAGKTSVVRALRHGPGEGALAALDDRTLALERGSLWDELQLYDFGGQPEYYPWHRLFITPEALYLVFTEASLPLEQLKREVQEQLDHLLSAAGAVPVLLVLAKADLAEDPSALDDKAHELERSMRDWAASMCAYSAGGRPLRVPLVLGAHVVSASTGQGLPDLRRAMRSALLATDGHGARLFPRFKEKVPMAYERVRSLLRAVAYGEGVASALECEPAAGGLLRSGEPPSVCFLHFQTLLKALKQALEGAPEKVRAPFLLDGPETVLKDALSLLEGEGHILRTGAGAEGRVHLDPSWLVDAVRGLADHRLCARYGTELQERAMRDLAKTWERAEGGLSSPQYVELLQAYARTGVAAEALLRRLFEPAMRRYGLRLAELRQIFEELDLLFETGEDGACVVPVRLDDSPPGGFEEECELGADAAACQVVGAFGLGYLPPGFTQRLVVAMRREFGQYHRCFSLGGVVKKRADSETKVLFFWDLQRCKLTLRAQSEGDGREAHRDALHQRVDDMKKVVLRVAEQWAGVDLTFTQEPVVNYKEAARANEQVCARQRLRGQRVHGTFKSEDALEMMKAADAVQQAGGTFTWVHNAQGKASWFDTWRQKCRQASVIIVLFSKSYRGNFTEALKQEAKVIKDMYESKLAKLYVFDPKKHGSEAVQVNLQKGAAGMGDIGAWLGFLRRHGVN